MSGEASRPATETPFADIEPTTYPDVRLLPNGRVAWRVATGLGGAFEWLSTADSTLGASKWFWASELPLADAQRMVPVGPLLGLLGEYERLRDDAASYSYETAVTYRSCAVHLRTLLASLTGEVPEVPETKE